MNSKMSSTFRAFFFKLILLSYTSDTISLHAVFFPKASVLLACSGNPVTFLTFLTARRVLQEHKTETRLG